MNKRESKIIKLENGREVKITGLPMNKNIAIMQILKNCNENGGEVEGLLKFMDFIELKNCCIPVVVKKEAEDFEGGFDYFIEDDILDLEDIQIIFNEIFELSNGKKANEKRKEAIKKIEEGKDTI